MSEARNSVGSSASTSTTSTRTKPQRSREENRERAFLAASRRTDRPLKDRYESALRASAMHKQRTGRSLRVTKQMVENDEMYEEVDESLAKEYRRLTTDLRAEAAVLSRQLQQMYFQAFENQKAAIPSQVAAEQQQQQQQQRQQPGNIARQMMTPADTPPKPADWTSMEGQPWLEHISMDPNASATPMLPEGYFDGNDEWLAAMASTELWTQPHLTNGPPTPSTPGSQPSSVPQTPLLCHPQYSLASQIRPVSQQSWNMAQQYYQPNDMMVGHDPISLSRSNSSTGYHPVQQNRPRHTSNPVTSIPPPSQESGYFATAPAFPSHPPANQWAWDGAPTSGAQCPLQYTYNNQNVHSR